LVKLAKTRIKMIYNFISKNSDYLIIHLHGTGGNENSLVEISQEIDENANLLGIRGEIIENGMSRFFKRIKPGIFDEENLIFETKKIYKFIVDFVKKENFDLNRTLIIGYSNGANILGSLLYHFGKFVQGAVLMHPMIPLQQLNPVNQNQLPIYITAGANDPLVTKQETIELINILDNNSAKVSYSFYNGGHSVSYSEILDIKRWYLNIKKSAIK